MSSLNIKLEDFAKDIVTQLQGLVPVRTGRLKNGLNFKIVKKNDSYYVNILMEDYFKWLKPKTKPTRLPTARELSMARPPLPKMNDLGLVSVNDLSPRSRGIMNKIDIQSAISKIDFKDLEDQIRKIVFSEFV